MIRAVLDTNVLVRAVIKPSGPLGAVQSRIRDGSYVHLYSEEVLEELVEVLNRPRLIKKYHIRGDLVEVLRQLILMRGECVRPDKRIRACRDPRDDKFLELAVCGRADVITSADQDLLVLDPFEGIPIVPPRDFLAATASH